MSVLWPCCLFLIVLIQAGSEPSFPEGIFSAKEEKKLEKNADDLEERIEVYTDASKRIHKSILKNISGKDFDRIPRQLETWCVLLSESLKDIEVHINPKKKKSKDLIKYEIQVRKAINDLRDFQTHAPYELQDLFDQSIDQADSVRGKMVDILFQPEKVSAKEKKK